MRLKTALGLDEDIYSLAFVVMLTDRYLAMWFDVESGKIVDETERENLESLTGAGGILQAIFNEYKENTDYVIVQQNDESKMI